MEIFTTAVTTGGMVVTYLDACAAYSEEARSLYHRFRWDLRVLEEIVAYFEKKQDPTRHCQSTLEDETLLRETAEYLAELMGKVTASFAKIQASGILGRNFNRALWVVRRNGLKELERELAEWTNRFDVRLLGLPPEIRTIIPNSSDLSENDIVVAPVLKSNLRMQEFASLASQAKKQRIADLLYDPSDQLISKIEASPNITSQPLELDTQQFVLASRSSPPGVHSGSDQFQKLVSDLGELTAALHCLEAGTNVGLLKMEYYCYHEATRRFLFIQTPPYPVDEVATLESLIERAPYSHLIVTRKSWVPLDQRVKLAQKLAEAVFFLHTAGFVHKNIAPSSFVTLQRPGLPPSEQFPFLIGDPYLMGFDMIRSNDGISVLEGAANRENQNRSNGGTIATRNQDVFKHPDRLQGDRSKRYIKSYDVYSLGVVLLQIGFWEPISTITRRLGNNHAEWPEELLKISQELGPRIGVRYQKVVAWCLGLKGDYVIRDSEFVREVLEHLEKVGDALSNA